MKKLILVRHAKSSWEFNVIDHERPLKKRGVKDAYLISNHIKSKVLRVDLVLSSDANRAKSTANIFTEILQISPEKFRLNHALYDFSGDHLIHTIKACDNDIDHLMLFGHNHAITYFVNTYGDKFIDNVPTCGLVIIDFNIERWSNLVKGKTVYSVFPRDLKL